MIKITNRAKMYFQDLILINRAAGINLKVIQNGCSGKSYALNLLHQIEFSEKDICLNIEGVKFKLEKKDTKDIRGLIIDLVKDDINEKITFTNPNILEKCGCGESFMMKK